MSDTKDLLKQSEIYVTFLEREIVELKKRLETISIQLKCFKEVELIEPSLDMPLDKIFDKYFKRYL